MTIACDQPPSWLIRNQQSGRLRIYSAELGKSSLLLHHCVVTLTSCHWLHGFRINKINSNLLIRFPVHRSHEIFALLDEALTIPKDELDRLLPLASLREHQHSSNKSRQLAVRRGSALGVFLIAETVFHIPYVLIITLVIALAIPVLKSIRRNLSRPRHLASEIKGLMFSGVLLGHGLPAEIILDAFMNDARTSLFSLTSTIQDHHKGESEFLTGMGEIVTLKLVGREIDHCKLKDANAGDNYHVDRLSHVLLESMVVEGEIIVLNRVVDGDWRPHRIKAGSIIQPGAFVIQGDAILRVLKSYSSHTAYAMASVEDSEEPDESGEESSPLEITNELINKVIKPITIGGGLLSYGLGAGEAAISLLKFDPVEDFSISHSASMLTTMSTLLLHGIHLNNNQALEALSNIDHLVISRSCIDRNGGILTREHINSSSDTPKGYLIRLLAGLQDFLLHDDEVPIWSDQLHHAGTPLSIAHVDLGNMEDEGWIVTLTNGETLQVIQQHQPHDQISRSHHTPLEIRRDKTVLGYVELSTHASDRWHAVFEALHEMEIDVHIVGSESKSSMHELVKQLRMNHSDNLHGNFDSNERLELVKNLQKDGSTVAYVGYVLDDFPAMIQAEVSIGIEIDSDSIFTAGISDVSIGPDVSWLPRLIMLCKRHQKTVKRNFALISGSNFLAVVGAAASLISPAAMILFADIPILLAELLSIKAMDSHGVFESHEKCSRTIDGVPNRRLSSRLPKAASHHSTQKLPEQG